jgi:UDP-2,3-diacylglucosamine hydrolase
MQGKKVYFLSDAHLGAKLLKDNREREIMLVEFLQSIKPDCLELYLLGDMFDFC